MPGYEVTRSIGSRRASLVPPIIAAVVVLVVAGASALLTGPTTSKAPATTRASEATAVATPAATLDGAAPVSVDCGAMLAYDCSTAIDAARIAIAEVPATVRSARAWPTVMCEDDRDCPIALLASSDPVGSVALTLVDRGVVWINVFRVPAPDRLDENRQVVEARIVRWFRASA